MEQKFQQGHLEFSADDFCQKEGVDIEDGQEL